MKKKFEELLYVDATGLKEVIDFCNDEGNQNPDGSRIFYMERAQTIRPFTKQNIGYGIRILANPGLKKEQKGYFQDFHRNLLDAFIRRKKAQVH